MHRSKWKDLQKNKEHKGLADQSVRKDALSKIDQKTKHFSYCQQKSKYALIVKTRR